MAPQSHSEGPAVAEPATEQPAAPNDDANEDEQPAADAPASPPLPSRHTAVAPGPRASRLQELYAQRLQRTLGKLAWQNFAGCYPTVARKAEGVLKQVQGQMVDKLGEKCEVSFSSNCYFPRLPMVDFGSWGQVEEGSYMDVVLQRRS